MVVLLLFVFEWNGNEFTNLIEPREIFVGGTERNIQDVNNDGVLDIIIEEGRGGDYAYFMGFPRRVTTHIYIWNGSKYALQNIQYSEPEYQFQAIQDADNYALLKNYDLSLNLYELVITDKALLSYSRELSEHVEWLFWNPMSIALATEPAPDDTEYPRLAAYAYYRIMHLHLVQDQVAAATTTYNTLQQGFGGDPYARPYAEMASAFWEAYQPAQSMYDGCAAAIQYATEHPELLVPLGSDYHGSQARIYKPEDVCPFR